ncbi:SgcJ/EcaC family oxidoreductase [Nocardia sp. NPDC003693]
MTTARETDETAIHSLLRAQMDAWAAGDGAAFADTFTPDADFVSVIGEFVRGRTELATVMQEGFDGFMKGTRMAEPDTTTLRFPASNVAVLVTVGDRPMPPGEAAPPEARSVQTRVAVRENGIWLFTTFQNTRISQFPQ